MKLFIKKIIQKIVWLIRKENDSLSVSPITVCWDRAVQSSADFIEKNLKKAMLFHDKKQFWKYSLRQADKAGLNLECGVFTGTSLRFFANQNTEKHFFGFDSFKGLSEDWHGHHKAKGAFDLGGVLPEMPSNVTLIKGLVEKTYGDLLRDKDEKISFLHIDTDTYSPAKHILKESLPFLQSGTIIVFDELYGYPNWEQGEYAALIETLDQETYELIAFCKTQAAIRII